MQFSYSAHDDLIKLFIKWWNSAGRKLIDIFK